MRCPKCGCYLFRLVKLSGTRVGAWCVDCDNEKGRDPAHPDYILYLEEAKQK